MSSAPLVDDTLAVAFVFVSVRVSKTWLIDSWAEQVNTDERCRRIYQKQPYHFTWFSNLESFMNRFAMKYAKISNSDINLHRKKCINLYRHFAIFIRAVVYELKKIISYEKREMNKFLAIMNSFPFFFVYF